MKTVTVATLKQRLSEYLHMVEAGDEITVTSHQRAVARLVPDSASGLRMRPSTRPASDLKRIVGITPAKTFSADEDLAWDRARR
jgi:prevent-host-death family protein